MNIVIYARYSSFGQREESIEGQLNACYDFAKQKGYTVIGEYIDRAASATNDQRAEFQRLVHDSEKGNFEAVLVYQLDRFARNRYDSAINKHKLKANGVRVLSAKENIADDPSGIILEGMLETIAEYYSADLSQKVKRGQALSAEKCQYNGGAIPLGYRVDENRKFQIDEDTAPIVKRVFEQFAQGKSEVDIIKELNEAGVTTSAGTSFKKNSFQNLLRNPRVTGLYKYGEVEIEGGMPRLISDDVFEACQARIKKQKNSPSSKEDYLLTTKLFCGCCKSMMVGTAGTGKSGKRHFYYTCKKTLKKECAKKYIKRALIEDAVTDSCRAMLTDKNIADISKNVARLCEKEANSPYVIQLKKEVTKREAAIENLMKALEHGEEVDMILERIKSNKEEKQNLEAEIKQEELAKTLLTEPEISFFLTDLRSNYINDDNYRKMLINVFVNKVYFYDDKVTIFLNASKGSPVEITQELENEVNGQLGEGSYSAVVAEDEGFEPSIRL